MPVTDVLISFCSCRRGERLAVKIVRNIEKYHYAAKVEVDILSDLQKSDSPSKQ